MRGCCRVIQLNTENTEGSCSAAVPSGHALCDFVGILRCIIVVILDRCLRKQSMCTEAGSRAHVTCTTRVIVRFCEPGVLCVYA